jgi:hypothetical protein
VKHPYQAVRDVVVADALGVFQRATNTAAARTDALGTELHVRLGLIEIGAAIAIKVVGIEESTDRFDTPSTKVQLEWQAAKRPGLFPSMRATLTVHPNSSNETQLDLEGRYMPPLGVIGSAADSLMLHRLAESAVGHFIGEVAERLRHELEPVAVAYASAPA